MKRLLLSASLCFAGLCQAATGQAAVVLTDDFEEERLGAFAFEGTTNLSYLPFQLGGSAGVADCTNGSQCVRFNRPLRTKAAFAFNAGDTISITADLGGQSDFQHSGGGTAFVGFVFDRFVELTQLEGFGYEAGGGGGSPTYDGGGVFGAANLTYNTFESLRFSGVASSAGSFKVFFSSLGGSSIYLDNIAISVSPAVPEPSTWAMLIMGFGVLGGALRFKRGSHTRRMNGTWRLRGSAS